MSKFFREYRPEQGLLLPPSLEDWLPGKLPVMADTATAVPKSRAVANLTGPDSRVLRESSSSGFV